MRLIKVWSDTKAEDVAIINPEHVVALVDYYTYEDEWGVEVLLVGGHKLRVQGETMDMLAALLIEPGEEEIE